MAVDEDRALELFGRLVMLSFDQGLGSFEMQVRGGSSSTEAKKLAALAAGREADFIAAGRSAVVSFLVSFFSNLEWDENVSIVANGLPLDEISDGLAGELFGDNGWMARFSHTPPT